MENLGIEPRLSELVTDEEIEHAMAALALAPGPEALHMQPSCVF